MSAITDEQDAKPVRQVPEGSRQQESQHLGFTQGSAAAGAANLNRS